MNISRLTTSWRSRTSCVIREPDRLVVWRHGRAHAVLIGIDGPVALASTRFPADSTSTSVLVSSITAARSHGVCPCERGRGPSPADDPPAHPRYHRADAHPRHRSAACRGAGCLCGGRPATLPLLDATTSPHQLQYFFATSIGRGLRRGAVGQRRFREGGCGRDSRCVHSGQDRRDVWQPVSRFVGVPPRQRSRRRVGRDWSRELAEDPGDGVGRKPDVRALHLSRRWRRRPRSPDGGHHPAGIHRRSRCGRPRQTPGRVVHTRTESRPLTGGHNLAPTRGGWRGGFFSGRDC